MKVAIVSFVIALNAFVSYGQRCPSNAAVYDFKFGDWDCTVVSDGDLSLEDPQGNFRVPAIAVKRSFQSLFLPTSPFKFPQNVLVLRRGRDRILIDTGLGNVKLFGEAGFLLKNMRAAGIPPWSITAVILTHGHFDHVSGMANPNGSPAFPNAQVFISRIENEFYSKPVAELARLYPDFPPAVIRFLIQNYKSNLAPYKGKIVLVGENEVVRPGIRMIATPGHTPGHSTVKVRSRGKRMYVTGDVFYSRPSNIQNPDWNAKSDANTTVAVRTRFRLLDTLSRGKYLALVYHETFPGLGYIVPRDAFYDFVPVAPQLGSGVRKVC